MAVLDGGLYQLIFSQRNGTSFLEVIQVNLIIYGITFLLHGAESILRSKPAFSQSRNSPHFMEPECSLPQSQMPVTCLCP